MRKILFLVMVVVAVVTMLAACASDNIHQPEPDLENDINNGQSRLLDSAMFKGTLTSGVPVLSYMFDPVSTSDSVSLNRYDDGYAKVCLGAFTIDVDTMKMTINIGEMVIDSIPYNNGVLKETSFHVQAGMYDTSGTVSGSYTEDGYISLVLDYKPGSMPFQCHSEFVTEK